MILVRRKAEFVLIVRKENAAGRACPATTRYVLNRANAVSFSTRRAACACCGETGAKKTPEKSGVFDECELSGTKRKRVRYFFAGWGSGIGAGAGAALMMSSSSTSKTSVAAGGMPWLPCSP